MARTAFPLQPFMTYKIKSTLTLPHSHAHTHTVSIPLVTKGTLWCPFCNYLLFLTASTLLPFPSSLGIFCVASVGSQQPLNQLRSQFLYVAPGRRGNRETKSVYVSSTKPGLITRYIHSFRADKTRHHFFMRAASLLL